MTGPQRKGNACAAGLAILVACLLAMLPLRPAAAQADHAFQTTARGLQYRDLQVGSGQTAALGDVAAIHFVVWLDENGVRGRQIYNSRDRGRTVSFVVGTSKVMPAWNDGVVGMRPGGRRLLLVPSDLAYGDRAVDDVIPANARLIMIIELLSLKPAVE